jgi:hypothetical protein
LGVSFRQSTPLHTPSTTSSPLTRGAGIFFLSNLCIHSCSRFHSPPPAACYELRRLLYLLEFILENAPDDTYLGMLLENEGTIFLVRVYVQAVTHEPVFLKNHHRQIFEPVEMFDENGE